MKTSHLEDEQCGVESKTIDKTLAILYAEDDPLDVELVQSLLEEEGISVTWTTVDNRESFKQALEKEHYDAIFSDYSMLQFDGMNALKICQELGRVPDTPFILLSGNIGEEVAIESLKSGATDYVLKQKLSRLVPCLKRALKEAEVRREDKVLHKALQQKTEELEVALEELRNTNQALEEQKQSLKIQAIHLEASRKSSEIRAQELALSNKYKTEFLTNMSHELRTPLNPMLVLCKMLKENREGNLNQRQIDSLEMLHYSSNSLLELINDILDLAKIEAGMVTTSPEVIRLSSYMEDLAQFYQVVAEDKGLTFTFIQEPSEDIEIMSDIKLLGQILKNFLSNAIKFTEEGGVTLKMHYPDIDVLFSESHLTSSNCIALSVIDTGIGIAMDKQEAIFERFQQEDGSITRKYGGTGLGLAIARQLSDLLSGEIQVTSTQEEGSHFILYVPLEWL